LVRPPSEIDTGGRTLQTPIIELLPVFGSFDAVKLVGELRGNG
jgi:hypothetical protein